MQKIQTLPPAFRNDTSASKPRTHGERNPPPGSGLPLLAIARGYAHGRRG